MPYHALLLIIFSLSAVLTGLIWTVQLVHYPGFINVGRETFSTYEALHRKRIFPLVGPLMAAELAATAWLILAGHVSILHMIAAALVILVWVHTWTFAAPAHFRLDREGYSKPVIRKLVLGNWVRTISWTVRALIYGYLLYELVSDQAAFHS